MATNTSRRVFIPPTEGERAALGGLIANLEARLAPSPTGACTAFLERLARLWPKLHGDGEWETVFEQYEADLGEFSVSHQVEAIVEHRRTSKWFPAIAELRTICERLRDDDVRRLRRAKLALYGPQDAPAAKPEVAAWDMRGARPRDFRAAFAALEKCRGATACA